MFLLRASLRSSRLNLKIKHCVIISFFFLFSKTKTFWFFVCGIKFISKFRNELHFFPILVLFTVQPLNIHSHWANSPTSSSPCAPPRPGRRWWGCGRRCRSRGGGGGASRPWSRRERYPRSAWQQDRREEFSSVIIKLVSKGAVSIETGKFQNFRLGSLRKGETHKRRSHESEQACRVFFNRCRHSIF